MFSMSPNAVQVAITDVRIAVAKESLEYGLHLHSGYLSNW